MSKKALLGCMLFGLAVFWGLSVKDGSAVGILAGSGLDAVAAGRVANALLGVLGVGATMLLTWGYLEDRDGVMVDHQRVRQVVSEK